MKEIIEKLQQEKNCFKVQVKKLQIEKAQLAVSNKKLIIKVSSLQKELERKPLPLVWIFYNTFLVLQLCNYYLLNCVNINKKTITFF